MFIFFKKKRISKYLSAARSYLNSNFKPGSYTASGKSNKQSQEKVLYRMPPSRRDIYTSKQEAQDHSANTCRQSGSESADSSREGLRYQSRGTIKYSDRNGSDDIIPNSGDRFTASSVRAFMSENTGNTGFSRTTCKLDSCLDLTFVDMLTRYINDKGWRDSHIYKSAQMDRRLFSKIMSDRNYKPSKDTALSLVIALKLSLNQANDMLSRAGYVLSHSNKRDVIIEYFIREKIYNLSDINQVLHQLDQKIIGR